MAAVRNVAERMLAEDKTRSKLSEEARKFDELRSDIQIGDAMIQQIHEAADKKRAGKKTSAAVEACHRIEQGAAVTKPKSLTVSVPKAQTLTTPDNTPTSSAGRLYTPPNTPHTPEPDKPPPLGLPVGLAHQDSLLVTRQRSKNANHQVHTPTATPDTHSHQSDFEVCTPPLIRLTGESSSGTVTLESVYGIATPPHALRPSMTDPNSPARRGRSPDREVHWNKKVIVHTVPAHDPSRRRIRSSQYSNGLLGDNCLLFTIPILLLTISFIYYMIIGPRQREPS